jgi:FkbM family methyltransferase
LKDLKPIQRISNTWHGLIDRPKDSFIDQHKLLSEIKIKNIFDLGAHLGDTVDRYIRRFPEATVYAFEPFPGAFQKLQARFQKNTHVRPVRSAVANVDGEKEFNILKHNASHSLLKPEGEAARWMYPDAEEDAVEVVDRIDVPVIKIDSFCKRESIDEIQILKMDVQGGELLALQGAIEKLRQGSIPLVYTEMLFVPIYSGQAYYYEICGFLAEYGYSLFDIYNCAYAKEGQIKWCDAIFISPAVATS